MALLRGAPAPKRYVLTGPHHLGDLFKLMAYRAVIFSIFFYKPVMFSDASEPVAVAPHDERVAKNGVRPIDVNDDFIRPWLRSGVPF